jgi:hypothetical protein
MRWQHGFFRLWVAGSALFVIAVTAVGYTEIKLEFDRSAAIQQAMKRRVEQHGERFIPVLCADARGVVGTDFQRSQFEDLIPAANRSQEKPNPFDNCWYKLSKFRQFFPEYNDLSDTQLSSKLHAKLGLPFGDTTHPWILLIYYICFALGIPLVVLTLGAVLAWVLRGFKAPSSVA